MILAGSSDAVDMTFTIILIFLVFVLIFATVTTVLRNKKRENRKPTSYEELKKRVEAIKAKYQAKRINDDKDDDDENEHKCEYDKERIKKLNKTCPNCHSDIDPLSSTCPVCGSSLTNICPVCGMINHPTSILCQECHTQLTKKKRRSTATKKSRKNRSKEDSWMEF